MRRVVVTGLGAVTPIGADAPSTWRAAVAGESGIDFIRSFDASEFPVRIAAEVKDFDPTQVASPKDARRLDRNVLFSLGAAREAVADAGLDGAYSPDRVGILFGTAIGGIAGIVEQVDLLRERGPDRVAPTFIPNVLVDAASGQLAIATGFRGPNYAPVSACATGSTAAGEAAELIRHLDAARRRGGDEGDQGRLRRARVRARRLLDEVRDGPLLRRGGRYRGDDVRPRRPRRRPAADDELRPSRPGLRSRLRSERGAA